MTIEAGHYDIGHEHRHLAPRSIEYLDRLARVRRFEHRVARLRKHSSRDGSHFVFILDEQNRLRPALDGVSARGRATRILETRRARQEHCERRADAWRTLDRDEPAG